MKVYCQIHIRSYSELTHASVRQTMRWVRGELEIVTHSEVRAAGPWALVNDKTHSEVRAAGPWAIGCFHLI